MIRQFNIEWLDAGYEPRVRPNPEYPNGVDLDLTTPGLPSCETALPYPARRCGSYLIECELCGIRLVITTAGRPDDPRSVKIACKRRRHRQ